MNGHSDNQLSKDIVAISVEKTLLEMGKPILEEVYSRLQSDYNCTFLDCLENPEYLTRILKNLYGNSYDLIINSIMKNLEKYIPDEKISIFIENVKK